MTNKLIELNKKYGLTEEIGDKLILRLVPLIFLPKEQIEVKMLEIYFILIVDLLGKEKAVQYIMDYFTEVK